MMFHLFFVVVKGQVLLGVTLKICCLIATKYHEVTIDTVRVLCLFRFITSAISFLAVTHS